MAGRIRRSYRRVNEDRAVLAALVAAIGTAIVASTLPDFLIMIPGGRRTEIFISVVGFLILAVSWISLHGRSGVGVAVFLQPEPTSGWSDARLLEYAAEAKGRHISFFYVNADELHPGPGVDRKSLTQKVIEARLKEENPRKSSQISFYLTCGLGNSFHLGREIFNSMQGASLRVRDFQEIAVHQVSNSGAVGTLPPLQLVGTPAGPRTSEANYPLPASVRMQTVALNPGHINRHALIVCISQNSASRAVDAQDAAQSGTHARYQVTAHDVCSTALVIECPNFPNDHRAYNELLKRTLHTWAGHLSSMNASQGSIPEGRLFISAPTSLAFALGALLPSTPRTQIIDYI
ncbi:hypothetical protein GA0115240_154118 [Streptomyces sp. DvalAA-14]|nr:hypothetical protein GA0115240_154118 [Streptomyces sp. DvalAA-14]